MRQLSPRSPGTGTSETPRSLRSQGTIPSLNLILLLAAVSTHAGDWVFLDDGQLRLGVKTNSGACIGFLSESKTGRNLLNHHDQGRFVQQSYYGAQDGSLWNKQPWRWNPVQGGAWRGEPSTLLTFTNSATTLHAKTQPKHWATGADIPDVTMEEWISLTGRVARIRFRMTFSGTNSHPPAHQELPAVFVENQFPNLAYYKGSSPWTRGEVTRKVPGDKNEYDALDENWAAYLDAQNWGVGVFAPGTSRSTHYHVKGPGGPGGSGCSYFAPIRTMAITPGMVFEYDVYLTIGTLAEIRDTAYALHAEH